MTSEADALGISTNERSREKLRVGVTVHLAYTKDGQVFEVCFGTPLEPAPKPEPKHIPEPVPAPLPKHIPEEVADWPPIYIGHTYCFIDVDQYVWGYIVDVGNNEGVYQLRVYQLEWKVILVHRSALRGRMSLWYDIAQKMTVSVEGVSDKYGTPLYYGRTSKGHTVFGKLANLITPLDAENRGMI